jgi:DNA-binding CsgD family transcriptional regulator
MTGPPPIPESSLAGLSAAERAVLDLARTGRSAREIADELVVTEATVRTHLSRIYSKLGVRGRIELLARLHPVLAAGPTDAAGPPAASVPLVNVRESAWRRLGRRTVLAGLIVAGLLMAGVATINAWPRVDHSYATFLADAAAGRVIEIDQNGIDLRYTLAGGSRGRAIVPSLFTNVDADVREAMQATGADVQAPSYLALAEGAASGVAHQITSLLVVILSLSIVVAAFAGFIWIAGTILRRSARA